MVTELCGSSSSKTGQKSAQPQIRCSQPTSAGCASQRSLRKLTEQRVQLLLGTLLGDGSMSFRTRYPHYQSNHGWNQHEYNLTKARILREFVRTSPKKAKNSGYGNYLSRFNTLSSPAFEFIRTLCYRQVGNKYKKHINQRWLDRLTWEGIAWWYMDDGSLLIKGPSALATFRTEGFLKRDITLLQRELTSRGIECSAHSYQKPNAKRRYWYIQCSVVGTIALITRTKPYAVKSMKYKFILPARQNTGVCQFCGSTYGLTSSMSRRNRSIKNPCCQSEACLKTRHRLLNENYRGKPGVREKKNRKERERYHKDLEESRRKNREKMRARLNVHKDEINRKRRKRREEKRQPVVKKCERCQRQAQLKHRLLKRQKSSA